MNSLKVISKRSLILILCVMLVMAFCLQPVNVSAEDGGEQIVGPALTDIEYDPVLRLKFANDTSFMGTVNGDKIILKYDDDSTETYVYSDDNNSSFVQQGGSKVIPMWFSEGAVEEESGYVGYDTETKTVYFQYKGITAYSPQEKNYLAKSLTFTQVKPKVMVAGNDSETMTDEEGVNYEYYPLGTYTIFQKGDNITAVYENPSGGTLEAEYFYNGNRFALDDELAPGAYSNYIDPGDLSLDMPDQETEHLVAGQEYSFDISWCERASSDYDYPTFSTADKPYKLQIQDGSEPIVPVEINSFDFDKVSGVNLVFSYDIYVPKNADCCELALECEREGDTQKTVYDYEDDAGKIKIPAKDLIKDEDLTKEKSSSYKVNVTLAAYDSDGRVIGRSDPVSVTIKLSNISKDSISLPEIPDKLLMGGPGQISKGIYTNYYYSWSAEGSSKSSAAKAVLCGNVTSVSSSSTSVIKVTKKNSLGVDAYYELKPLETGTSKITLKYELNGEETTISKKVTVSDRYLEFDYSQGLKEGYLFALPVGYSYSYTLSAKLYVYNSSTKKYVFEGDVTDYVAFAADAEGYTDNGYKPTDDIKCTLSGNKITVSAPVDAPENTYYIRVSGSYGKASGDVGLICCNVLKSFGRIIPNNDFYCPRKDASAVFDPSFVKYSKGKESSLSVSTLRLEFSGLTVKDKSGKTIKSGSSFTKTQLPLTIKGTSEKAYLYVYAFDSKGNNVASVSFDNYSLSNVEAKLSSKSMTFTGEALKPTVTLKYAGKTISKTGYKITYMNNKDVGSATVKIQDKNNDGNVKYVTFKIIPKKASIKTPEAGTKAITFNWTAQKSKMSTERITGYQVQAATDKAFTKNKKTVKKSGYTTTSYKMTGLKAKTTYYVRIRTYKKIGRTTYYSEWSTVKTVKTN